MAPLLVLALGGDPPEAVRVPRVDTEIEIDGVLSEAVWARAAVLRGFSQYLPVDGRPAEDSTVVRVWYSPTAIHFGIAAYESHGVVQATLADRDKIDGDDHVRLVLDTFDDRRQAFVFGVNPVGVQADGILSDASRRGGSFMHAAAAGYVVDLSPDYVYQSKGRLTAEGYEIEVRVPFKSLRYQAAETQDWGINIIRRVQHSGYEDTWSPVLQADPSFLAKSGRLAGLSDLRRGLVLDLNPEMTSSIPGGRSASGWSYDAQRPEIGGNLRWGITNNLFLNGTVNPDFSQVEADVAQVQFDPRRALFFPEKRPFFLDGLEQFATPNQLVYTRRLANPEGAAKLTGKISNTNVALLSGLDARSTSADGSLPVYNWLRVRRDILGQSTLGAVYTDKIDGDGFNRVAAADARLVLGPYALQAQLGGSVTRAGGETAAAPVWMVTASRAGRRYGFSSSITGFHPDFRTESGFVSRVGVVHANLQPQVTLFGAPGAGVERWTGSVTLDGTWDYDRFFDGKTPNDSKLHLNSRFTLRGGWSLGTSVLIETFKYPGELYTAYFIERMTTAGVDTVPYVGTDRLSNLDVVFSVSTPRFRTFSASAFVVFGRDENFFEWAPANIVIADVSGDWRPTEQLRVDFRYSHTQYIRPSDWSNVGLRRIPRLKVEYQLSRAVFLRVVGQYDADFVDDLRDNSRTEAPILLRAADGTYSRAVTSTRNDFRVDWLFSYRPTPGTVFFAGYGTTLDEPRSFGFDGLRRAADGFFVKLSYLWRL